MLAWVLTDLDAVVSGQGQQGIGTPAQAGQRWERFRSASDGSG
ncbi:hypothetical protein [Pseudonocardia humida]|nr:hypothetical protein [Pseudonocardia humida]